MSGGGGGDDGERNEGAVADLELLVKCRDAAHAVLNLQCFQYFMDSEEYSKYNEKRIVLEACQEDQRSPDMGEEHEAFGTAMLSARRRRPRARRADFTDVIFVKNGWGVYNAVDEYSRIGVGEPEAHPRAIFARISIRNLL